MTGPSQAFVVPSKPPVISFSLGNHSFGKGAIGILTGDKGERVEPLKIGPKGFATFNVDGVEMTTECPNLLLSKFLKPEQDDKPKAKGKPKGKAKAKAEPKAKPVPKAKPKPLEIDDDEVVELEDAAPPPKVEPKKGKKGKVEPKKGKKGKVEPEKGMKGKQA